MQTAHRILLNCQRELARPLQRPRLQPIRFTLLTVAYPSLRLLVEDGRGHAERGLPELFGTSILWVH